MKEMKIGIGRRGVRFLGNGREWRISDLLYADDLFVCGESEENMGVMLGRFTELCRRRGLKVNAGKIKMNGDEGLE